MDGRAGKRLRTGESRASGNGPCATSPEKTMLRTQIRIATRRVRITRDRWLLPAARNPHLADEVSRSILPLPLIMVSQIQRSGGTLMSQLLDGHPELRVFPGELHLAKPKDSWPRLRMWLPPAILFRQLVDHRCIEYARIGYQKAILSDEKLPFDYDVGLHCAAFCKAMERTKPTTQRQVFDIYFSTFFGAWLNHRNHGRPKFFCAFAADFAIPQATVAAFFADYPDGKLVSVLRDPASWTASALNKTTSKRKFATAARAIAYWRRSAQALIRNKMARPDTVLIITFSDLIGRTSDTIRTVAGFLGIGFTDSLLVPTFNSEPVQSNSSFSAVKGFVDKSVLDRPPGITSDPGDEALFQQALAHCTRPAAVQAQPDA